jgi:signal peptidase I
MFFISLITYFTAIYLIYFKKIMWKPILTGILTTIVISSFIFSLEIAKQYAIFLVIIYLSSIFIKLTARFIWKIIKSIDHRRKFTTCFLYLFLYCFALFLIITTTKQEWLNWFYFLIYFPLDYYYFQFIPWPDQKGKQANISKQDEWEEGITFAIIAATLIHVFFLQPFTIPTSSMEKSMLVGDFLIVSKVNYGANIPNTPLFLPFMHQKIPGTQNTPSYSKLIQLGYNRLPGFQSIKNNDIVVFNFPADTLREHIPFDKKMNYVKRCVGIAGDSLEIIEKDVYINGKQIIKTKNIITQFQYIIKPKDSVYVSANVMSSLEQLLIENDIETYAQYASQKGYSQLMKLNEKRKNEKKYGPLKNTGFFIVFLTNDEKRIIEKTVNKWFVFSEQEFEKNLFPKTLKKDWTSNNYGPIYIPKKGDTLTLNKENIHFYKKIIEDYENNKLEILNTDLIVINEQPTKSYEVKMNYYWMMGDNRHNSEDSRVWGFVPENHIVGKPIFTWLSINFNAINKKSFIDKIGIIRWERSPIIWILLTIFIINIGKRFLKSKQRTSK